MRAQGLVTIRSSNLEARHRLSPDALVAFLRALHPEGEAQLPKFQATVLRSESACRISPNGDGSVAGWPRIRRLGNVQGALFCETGLEWHSDGVGRWTALHCHGSGGGDGGETLFADSRRIFENLDANQKNQAIATMVVYSHRFTAGKGSPSAVDFRHGLRMGPFGTRLLKPVRYRSSCQKVSDPTFGRYTLPLVQIGKDGRPFITVDIRHMEFVVVCGQVFFRQKISRLARCHPSNGSPSRTCTFKILQLSENRIDKRRCL